MEEIKSSNGIESIGLQGPTVNHDLNRGAKLFMLQKESSPTTQRRTATMGTDRDSGLLEHLRQQRNENPNDNTKKQNFICYQERIGALCSTDHKWVQQQQVMQNKLIICKRHLHVENSKWSFGRQFREKGR